MFVGTYPDTESAQADYKVVRRLHSDGVVGTYDDAVVGKDEEDNVHVHLHEKPTQYGAWTGLEVGTFVGILFAPSMLVANLAGAATRWAPQLAISSVTCGGGCRAPT